MLVLLFLTLLISHQCCKDKRQVSTGSTSSQWSNSKSWDSGSLGGPQQRNNYRQPGLEQSGGQFLPSSKQPRQVSRLEVEVDDRPVWGLADTGANQPLAKVKSNDEQVDPRGIDRKDEDEEELWVPESLADFVTNPSLINCLNYCEGPRNDTFLATGVPYAAGGVDAKLHEFPHMTALGFGRGNDVRGRSVIAWNSCGGSLISNNFVLTAAHCLDSEMGPPTVVRIGEHDLSRTDEGAKPQDLAISRIIPHPAYNASKNLYNDIALIQLARHVNFTKEMRPACLHQGASIKRNELFYYNKTSPEAAVATGWGNTGFVDAPADILQKVYLDIINNTACRKFLGTDPYIPTGVNEATQVCAGKLAGGVDTCLGDSGGPLQIENHVFNALRKCPHEIVGITSFGRFCADKDSPSVYTRVSAYVPWIESIVWPGKIKITRKWPISDRASWA